MEQIRKTKQVQREEVTPVEETVPGEQADHTLTDEMLDEIDSVLEQNAEEFVSSFIQKGGQ